MKTNPVNVASQVCAVTMQSNLSPGLPISNPDTTLASDKIAKVAHAVFGTKEFLLAIGALFFASGAVIAGQHYIAKPTNSWFNRLRSKVYPVDHSNRSVKGSSRYSTGYSGGSYDPYTDLYSPSNPLNPSIYTSAYDHVTGETKWGYSYDNGMTIAY